MLRSHHLLIALHFVLLAADGVAALERSGPPAHAALQRSDTQEPDTPRAGDRCDSVCITPTRTVSFETSQGTQMNVDVSPDGQTLLFDLLGDLYTVPRSGGRAIRLTSGMAIDVQRARRYARPDQLIDPSISM